ncbi:MAG: hypothetical protein QOE58_403 [Actinomycetota bacterium]|jgi:HEAT repeat protein|nr:hypothetical protein [Actinomycetota bacterium]
MTQQLPSQARKQVSSQARILAVLQLAEDEPELDDLQPYLDDPDAEVRVTAVNTLTEATPDGFATALVDALLDSEPTVRRAAAAALRESEELLPTDDTLRGGLTKAALVDDVFVREVVFGTLRALRLGNLEVFSAGLEDEATGVRIEALGGLVSLNLAEAVSQAWTDPEREVRVAAARGLGTIGDPCAATTLARLATDPEPLVRASALEAAKGLGCPSPLEDLAVAALTDPAWQVRKGAAIALGATAPDVAIQPLVQAITDVHIDVRKTAVRSLARWAKLPTVSAALTRALQDPDADVRGYARHGLAAES